MSLHCTRCDGTGFINLDEEAIDAEIEDLIETQGDRHMAIREWIRREGSTSQPDASLCDCCSDGHDWYGSPGEHSDYRGPRAREPFPECY